MTGDQIRDAVLRAVAVIGLAGVALIHVLDAHNTFTSTPYIGWTSPRADDNYVFYLRRGALERHPK